MRDRRVDPYDILFGRWSVAVTLTITATALASLFVRSLSPPSFELCWFKRLTALPCPGCGMTRAVLRLARGDVVEALRFNPFALLLLPYSLAAASSLLWPEGWRSRLRQVLTANRQNFNRLYTGTLSAFLTYGALRTAAVALGLLTWP